VSYKNHSTVAQGITQCLCANFYFTFVYHSSLRSSANAMKRNIQLYDCTLPSHTSVAEAASFTSSTRCGKKQVDVKGHTPFKSGQKQQDSSLVQLEKNHF